MKNRAQADDKAPQPAENLVPEDPFYGQLDQDALAQIRSFDSKPELKTLVKHGVFLWWSDRLPAWIHPDDIELARDLVPGYRVFRREMCEGYADRELGYAKLCYGLESFRALPIIWLEVPDTGFAVGDRVEIKSEHGKRRPGLATITGMTWDRHRQRVQFKLRRNDMPLPDPYLAENLVPALRLGGHFNHRELVRSNQGSFR